MVFCGFGFETGLDFALLGLKQVMVFEGESQKCIIVFVVNSEWIRKKSNNRNISLELNFNNFVVGRLDQVWFDNSAENNIIWSEIGWDMDL